MASTRKSERTHILTVAVEDYFHSTALNQLVPDRHKERLESRVVQNTERAIDLLDRHNQRATFFVLGTLAEKHPKLVRRIFEAGHEVACKGYVRKLFSEHTEETFKEDVYRSKQAVEGALGRSVHGYRIAQGSIGDSDLWALDILTEAGFKYDSSIYPQGRSVAKNRKLQFPFRHHCEHGSIMEFPLSSLAIGGFSLQVAGGNYVRQLPTQAVSAAIAFWHRRYLSPFNMHFHVWELDADLPQIASAAGLTWIRQYRNLDLMEARLSRILEQYHFTSLAAMQLLVQEVLDHAPEPRARQPVVPMLEPRVDGEKTNISIVVPCFNESLVLSYLDRTLEDVTRSFSPRYNVSFLLVDDCSTDNTWELMQERFGDRDNVTLLRHEQNKGVAGAILTGIRAAKTEIVCSIDADCTYDPAQLADLLDLLGPDVAMVTASPYHRSGRVVGVPQWRLFLSRNLSRLYALTLNHDFATYTACFRAYRKSRVENLTLSDGGFLGVAEMLVQLDLAGEQLAECPATLETRLLGVSKLKTLRTIRGHLRLLMSIPAMRKQITAPVAPSPAD